MILYKKTTNQKFQFNKAIEGAPLDQKGNLDYTTFTRIIKRGKQDDEQSLK